MSFWKNALTSLGIGSAEIDAELDSDKYRAGDMVIGKLHIQGGSQDQKVDQITLDLVTEYVEKVDDKKVTRQAVIDEFAIHEPFTIAAGEKRVDSFSFQLSPDTPVTIAGTKVWVQTGLDIKQAIDPTDKDAIEVLPPKLVDEILSAIKQIGFRIRKVECQRSPRSLRTRLPFIQEFEFVPAGGEFRSKLDELECVFVPRDESSVDVLMEVDRKPRGIGGMLAEALDADESKVRFSVTDKDIPDLKQKLAQVIEQHS